MTNALIDLSNALAKVVDSAGPGVVRVEARRRLPASGVVWSADGLVITANHVVSRDENIGVGLADGSQVQAELIGRDPTTDVALLRAQASDLAPTTRADAQTLAAGNLVLALGRPGHSAQATLGIISALGERWRTRMGGQVDRYLQTDVVMYPGFSGGPLVGSNGHLVGMNSSALAPGASLALPTNTLARVADSLLAHGRVKGGYLGVSSQRVRLPKSVREELGQKTGLLVVSVEADSPAEKAGLTLGDTIVRLDDAAVHHHEDLLALLTGDRIGVSTPLTIVRAGRTETLEVNIGERPQS